MLLIIVLFFCNNRGTAAAQQPNSTAALEVFRRELATCSSSEEYQMQPSSNAAAATVTAAVVMEARIRAVSLAKSCVDQWLELRQRTNEDEEIVFHLTEQEMQSTAVRVMRTIISLPCRIPSCSIP